MADRIWEDMERRAARLAEHPDMGRARPEIGAGARSLVAERWLILYRKTDDGVEIVRIVDSARDLTKLEWKAKGKTEK